MSAGFSLASDGMKVAPTCPASVFSCSIAAGRYTSAETSATFFFSLMSLRASLALDVVFPEPCRPAMRMTAGGWVARLSALFSSPMMRTSSFLTVLIKAWSGESLRLTSWPMAAFLMVSMTSLTTGRATSASISAMRTSRRAWVMFSSVMRAWPRSFLKVPCKRSLRLSNMGFPLGW